MISFVVVWLDFTLVVLIYSCYWCFGLGLCIGLVVVVYFVMFVWIEICVGCFVWFGLRDNLLFWVLWCCF